MQTNDINQIKNKRKSHHQLSHHQDHHKIQKTRGLKQQLILLLLLQLIKSQRQKQTAKMPIPTTLEQQFSSLSTDDVADDSKKKVDATTGGVVTAAALVTPTKADLDGEQHSFSSEEGETPSSKDVQMLVQKTEHKLKEERGELSEEPLLKENPHRFVIFPIQDNDVSIVLYDMNGV